MKHRGCLLPAGLAGLALSLSIAPARAQVPVACTPTPIEVVRSRGGTIDYLGSVSNIPDLCRVVRSGEAGDYYYGVWKSDWPGAGQAYPALKTVINGGLNSKASFITRSFPGMQWVDTLVNEGLEYVSVDGRPYATLRVMHEREGIEGNTYHSRITVWRDVNTGAALRTYEQQISGQSYGPDTTWQAVKVQPIPPGKAG
ncbi:MAG: hypothetical protein RQ966_13735 [Acetobacteraceae bacterium]|nr:hypothetical protein [Acetobacteraceae bacterium]